MLHDEVPVRRCLMHYNPLTMISTESLSQEWLETVSRELGYPDKGLLEKRSKRPDPGREGGSTPKACADEEDGEYSANPENSINLQTGAAESPAKKKDYADRRSN